MANPANAQPNPKEYVDKTITEQDKYHADLFQAFVAYTRRTSKKRDNGDEIANILGVLAQSEKYDKTSKSALSEVATSLANVEEYRDYHVQSLENHVLQELAKFGNQHKGSQPDLRRSLNQSQRRRSQAAAANAQETFNRQLIDFEAKRVSGLKTVMQNFVFSELAWHLKAAELYSNAFKSLKGINETEDLEEFSRSLQLQGSGTQPRADRHRTHSSTLS